MYPEAPKSKKRLIIVIAVISLILAALIISLVTRHSSQNDNSTAHPQRISDTFVDEVVKGQADVSYKLFAAANKAYTSENAWKLTVSKLKASYHGQPQFVNAGPQKLTGSIRVQQFTYRIAATDKGNYILTVYMTNSDGDWRVLQFNSAKEGTAI